MAAHLAEQDVDPQYFAFRWITVLFAHDIERLEEVQRVWDFLLGDPGGCKDAVMRVCAALVLVRRRVCHRFELRTQQTQGSAR